MNLIKIKESKLLKLSVLSAALFVILTAGCFSNSIDIITAELKNKITMSTALK